MKKIRCTLGTEEAKVAQREVEVYRLFDHEYIIRMLVRNKTTCFFCFFKFNNEAK